MKKIMALLLCAVLLCSYALPAFAATGVTFKLTPATTTLKRGDTVKVTVDVSSGSLVDSFGIKFRFDSNVFEITGGRNEIKKTYEYNENDEEIVAVSNFNKTEGSMSVSLYIPIAPNANLGYVTLKVKDTAPIGAATFTGDAATNFAGCNTITFNITCDHQWSAWSQGDATNHTHTCSKCGGTETAAHSWGNETVTKQPTCKDTGSKTLTCSVCNRTKTETIAKTNDHTYGAWQNADANNHKRTCTVCQNATDTATHTWNNGTVTKQPTCKEEGVKTYTCTTCNATKTESVAKTTDHTYGAWQKVDDTNHKRTCTVCQNVSETKPHAWNNGTVTKQPTCKEGGVKTYTCTTCNATKTEPVAKTTDHTYGAWQKVDDTNHKRTCTVCQNVSETKPHAWNNGTVTKQPTCKEEGVKTYTCSTCNATKTEPVAKTTNHTYGAWEKVDDTNHKRTCTVCQNVSETKPHAWNNGTVTKQPTCKEEGVKTYTCSTCNGTKTEAIAKTTNHTYGAWEKADDTNHKRTCTVCQTAVETKTHTWNNGTVTKQPTCKEEGVKTYVCSGCSATKTETLAKTNDHKLTAWQTTGDAQHTRSCTICEVYTETVNHTWNNGAVTKPNTCKEDGVKTYTCTGCAATKTEVLPKTQNHTLSAWQNISDTQHKRTCTVCEIYSETADHGFGTEWSKDKNEHYHRCADCGAKKDAAAHTPGAEATEKNPQVCTVCSYIIKPALGHTHSWATQLTKDETGHWYACSGCNEKKDFKAHDFANDCDGLCETCQFTRTTEHKFATEWSSDESGHFHACSVCGEKADAAEHAPGVEATETTAQTCTVCDYEVAPALGHTHVFSEVWEKDDAKHWQVCECGEKTEAVDHIWSEDGTVCTVCLAEHVEEETPSAGGNNLALIIGGIVAAVAAAGVVLVIVLKKKK